MEKLWAPWRMKYVQNTDSCEGGCVFCLEEGCDDIKCRILQRGKHAFVIMNIYPYNNGHLLIAPYRHTADLAGLTPEEKLEIMELLGLWTKILKKAMSCHGFNVGANLGRIAGAGIADHLHFHIVPRWNGDTNFMPVIGNTKVLPESLEDCYCQLREKLLEFADGQSGQ